MLGRNDLLSAYIDSRRLFSSTPLPLAALVTSFLFRRLAWPSTPHISRQPGFRSQHFAGASGDAFLIATSLSTGRYRACRQHGAARQLQLFPGLNSILLISSFLSLITGARSKHHARRSRMAAFRLMVGSISLTAQYLVPHTTREQGRLAPFGRPTRAWCWTL